MITFPRIPYDRKINYRSFLRENIIITEKLDGFNVCLRNGRVYSGKDSSSTPHIADYLAMVKKHHSHKTVGSEEYYVFGEDLYAKHVCEYEPIAEDKTFYVFAVAKETDTGIYYLSWDEAEFFAKSKGFETVPVLHRGIFYKETKMRWFINNLKERPSALGGEMEGVVIRLATGCRKSEYGDMVFKSVCSRGDEK